jgi:hypothetical protein
VEVFKPAWYSRPLPPSRKQQQQQGRGGRGDPADALYADLQPSPSPGGGGGGGGAGPEAKAALLAGAQRSHSPLHFSRKISLSNLTRREAGRQGGGGGGSDEELDLPYLALCRVLLYRTYEVEGPITGADISYAANSDYDSVHSAQWCVLHVHVCIVSLHMN